MSMTEISAIPAREQLTDTAGEDTGPAAGHVGNIRREWQTGDTTNRLDSVKETQSSALGVAKVSPPSLKSLKTVHD